MSYRDFCYLLPTPSYKRMNIGSFFAIFRSDFTALNTPSQQFVYWNENHRGGTKRAVWSELNELICLREGVSEKQDYYIAWHSLLRGFVLVQVVYYFVKVLSLPFPTMQKKFDRTFCKMRLLAHDFSATQITIKLHHYNTCFVSVLGDLPCASHFNGKMSHVASWW